MVKLLLLSACLLAVACVHARKIPLSPLALKYKNLNYFENDPDIQLEEDNTDDNTPVTYTGDNTKAKIVTQENYHKGQGKFKYALNTENGISVQQAGKLKDDKTFVVQGSYSYTGADGRRYRVRYTADEFGYHPKTELEIDLPDVDDNQNDLPDVKPFKPTFNAIRVQKQTPKPFEQSYEVATQRPSFATAPLIPNVPRPSAHGGVFPNSPVQADPNANPFGNPGPNVGNYYLPPNDYLPPGGASVPGRGVTFEQDDLVAPPTFHGHSVDSVFKYV